MLENELTQQGEHMMKVCNACRYCEGYCAVWRAMEYRREFSSGDLSYLANLCHDCSDCYYACQYAPPHEFDINPPKVFGQLRAKSWDQYAVLPQMGKAVRKYGLLAPTALSALGVVLFSIIAAIAAKDVSNTQAVADFYQVVPHGAMVAVFVLVSAYVVVALFMGLFRFWRDCGEKPINIINPYAIGIAFREALRLDYLDGDGWGCTYPEEKPSQQRRTFHHLTFYGFLLCFAATTAAAFCAYVLNWPPPYAFYSLPVLLGTAGGLGIMVGTFGLLMLKLRRNRDISDNENVTADVSFVFMLMLTSLSGLVLLVFRHTSSMPLLLIVHLGIVLGFFIMLPHGKFVHGIYRFAALVKYALERNREKALGA